MTDYKAESIRILKGLEAVRLRPGMYIGSTGKSGLHHLVYEIVDNSIDEVMAGFCNTIRVTLFEDNTVEIEDNGRGIPVDTHPETGRSALEVVMTTLHAGGKFSKNIYKVSGGLHGVGASVVNALSEILEVWIHREGKIYYQKYSRGFPQCEVTVIGETDKQGTIVRFKPDDQIFSILKFDPDLIENKLRELAFLNPQVKIIFEDLANEYTVTMHYEGGLREYARYLASGRKPIHETIEVSGELDEIIVKIAIMYTDSYEEEKIYSYANNIRTIDHGTHVTAFKNTFTKMLNEYARSLGILKKDESFSGEDVREGLIAIVTVLMKEPEFEGQTKSKLGSESAGIAVSRILKEKLSEYFEVNKQVLKVILEKVLKTMRAREAARKARELARRKNAMENLSLPGKLADCVSSNVENSELFIVEGDSAGGSAKQARDREYQAILPLRGKILNVEKSSMQKLLANEQIKDIIVAVGTGIGDSFDSSKLRYGKIIIMTDADIDGAHIRTLLLTFFFRYMKPLIEDGRIYIAVPPLYKVSFSSNSVYVYTEEDFQALRRELGEERKLEVQRYKGLGEMNPEQLWETTMNPETRKLIQVNIENAEEADALFEILMGESPSERRRFIERHALKVTYLDV
ncbi:MAG TPA: DNA topoisomerase (ATP-hydrolyzing) subunit B, partial [Pseudothermotoga sp.]|uniref:DNA topoisomerase (ATP-hydrolyzing) subunit B n=1 Tax=Pseudothermotoga lettingae TaxID=177758 RepID=UPI000746F64E|nr:DNA topoisomerase (ATP-hydrolyzing) subunit B [Pseudothermotoga lettingae]KUK21571.1 MAG: DNA gyrase subunit B [Pseudothermotoga lettingae]HBT26609.1 DNA topoisomerase (ATP-hydrolyzing) subunit B [Pseudothermotoga sp.]